MRLDLPLQGLDLLVEGGQDRDLRADGGGVGGGDDRRAGRGARLRSAAWIARGLRGDVAAAGALERGADLAAVSAAAAEAGSGALASSSSVSAASRSSKASSAAGKYSRSACRSRSSVPGAFPDQRLVRAGDHLDRLGLRRCRRRPGAAGAQSVRTMSASMCASPASLLAPDTPCRSRYRAACSGLTAIHRVAGRDQRLHPRTAVGLDPDHHLGVVVGVRRRAARRSSRAAGRCRPRPRAAGPWPAGARPRPSARRRGGPRPSHLPRTATASPVLDIRSPSAASGRTISDLMNQCSRRNRRARHPISDQLSRPTGRGTIFHRTQRPGTTSAHLPAATRHRVCRMD